MRCWKHTPPPAVALRRISLFIGIKPERDTTPAKTAAEAVAEANAALVPVMHGRPDDPLLDLVEW